MNWIAKIAAWARAARWHPPLLHLLEMLPIFGLGWLVSTPLGGTISVWAWYWSRKETETRAANAPKGQLLKAWQLGWWPWTWGLWGFVDFAVPAVASLLLALGLRHFGF
jgi:hypothetical protein